MSRSLELAAWPEAARAEQAEMKVFSHWGVRWPEHRHPRNRFIDGDRCDHRPRKRQSRWIGRF